MSIDPVLEAVRAIVTRVAGPERTPAVVNRDTRLSEDYWLDSIELLKVVLTCEADLHITFDAEKDFCRTHFETLGALAELIRARQASQPPDA